MGIVKTGIKRRTRLLREILRPPKPGSLAHRSATPTATVATVRKPLRERRRKRPPKRITALTYTVPPASRLVESPVFVLAPVRSGSTLLRMLLNSHPRIRAPHELHLRAIGVNLVPGYSVRAMRGIDLDQAELEHVLWDRVLSLELERSGKELIADKTPGNVWAWERLRYAWPKARFLILLRHPEGIVSSLENGMPNASRSAIQRNVLKYFVPLEKAQRTLDCLTVRYEDLTADPEAVTRQVCAYLGQEWDPVMLDYGAQDHGPLRHNLGDCSEKIRSGSVQPARPVSGIDALSPKLRAFASAWGYV
ncbi:sulfotransferase [Streptomyces sp. B6B3]|uniref:sulfotransferase family protein n=1 Tax=Streptomyces sp. B6B3 TaxID=3153570 RepID=UPI00325F7AC0